MTSAIYKDPPPPYTSRASSKCSETSPLISKIPGYSRTDSRSAKDKSADEALKICLTVISAFIFAFMVLGIIFLSSHEQAKGPEIKVVNFKVGIIGAGPAGIAAALGVRKEVLSQAGRFKDLNVDVRVKIIIYEEKGRVGGRMAVEDRKLLGIDVEDVAGGAFDGNLLETIGGVVGEKKQENVFTESEYLGMGKVAFFDTTHIVTETYRPYATTPWGHYLSLFRTYFSSIWLAPKIPIGTMKSFNAFLRTMAETSSSTPTVQQMIRIMSKQYTFVPFSISARERLGKNGIRDNYIRDILAPQVRRHTGQSIEDLSDLALSMALEREDMGCPKPTNGGVFQMMLENALKESGAILRPLSKVTKVSWEEVIEGYENWFVQWEDILDDEASPNAEIVDKIIIAAPSNYSELLGDMEHKKQFSSLGTDHDIEYRPVYITFFLVSSPISSSILKAGSSDPLPAQLLPIIDPDHPNDPKTSNSESIIELSLLRSIINTTNTQSPKYLYRLLSSNPISNHSLSTTFGFENDLKIENWTQQEIPYAYPVMQPLLPKDIQGDFRLGENIWTTSGGEGPLGSSVDLAWMVGGNVGRLVGRNIGGEGVEGRLRDWGIEGEEGKDE
ncbi:hypothetical protein SBOR_7849 [Sclerotinia borealis F-4128]|uniref:Prenylcysteine lyase domain-containing protein n=1 Tax=Sclerotinia borealis (strain F-4128) TaxID=1432307 RepID=W9C4P9_SCLBF|nr:hypothetical protein SBOR_7849 [Sclerotinia borealis F-4128]